MNINTERQKNWATLCKTWKDKWPVYTNDYNDTDRAINIYTFIEVLNDVMNENHIVITDAGSPSYALPQNLKCKSNQRFIFSAAQADMGFSIPGSVGVAKANPNKHIIVVTGDGSFNSNLQELAVIKYHRLPISIFVLDNNGYLSIKNTQKKFFENRVYGVNPSTGIMFADLVKSAKLFNLDYYVLDRISDMQKIIMEILDSSKPKIVQVISQEEQDIIPTQMFKTVNGSRVQPGLDDMYPFIEEQDYIEERKKALNI